MERVADEILSQVKTEPAGPRVRAHGTQVIELAMKDLKQLQNPRVHPEREIEGLMEAIKKYGFTDPIHVSKSDHTLLEGYARVEAATRLNLPTVRAIEIDIDPSEYYVAMILGNRLAEMASWDFMSLMHIYEEQLRVHDVPPPELGFSTEEFDNMTRWSKEQSESSAGFDLSEYVERNPGAATAVPLPAALRDHPDENRVVEITLSVAKERWELIRVELEADLVSIAEKFQGVTFSQPKIKKLLS